MSEDAVGAVARGIYYAFRQPMISVETPWFDQLPHDAQQFLRMQAREGLNRLRQNVTDGMVAAGAAMGEDADPETIFVAMLDAALKDYIQ